MYIAPEGDTPLVKTHGLKFTDGDCVSLDEAEHAVFLAKAEVNPHFVVDRGESEQAPRRRGRPPKVSADVENEG